MRLPSDLDYWRVPGISNEIKEILENSRPSTLGAAGRLAGMTPAALVILLRYVRKRGVASGSKGEAEAVA